MADTRGLLARYDKLGREILDACASAGRKTGDVKLVAVSKFHSAEDMAVIAQAGQVDFGENYVQEAFGKMEELFPRFPELRWHMIGHVQSRKAAQIAGKFSLIHTLDSQKLADGLEKKLADLNREQAVLMEVNIADEEQKSGVPAYKLQELGEYVLKNCPHLRLLGLMCLPPVFDSGDAARPWFERLRKLRDELVPRLGIKLPELSMGMSGDFQAAIAEGATIVRIGTDIFGPRPAKLNPRAS